MSTNGKIEYRRVYWDSEPLLKKPRVWPNISFESRQAFVVLAAFKIPAVLLDPVERQLEAHWLREYRQTRDSAKSKFDSLSEMMKQAGLSTEGLTTKWTSNEDALEAYRKKVDEVVREHSLLRRAPNLRATAELFDMAIHRHKPFGEEGKNFQDAVIVLTAIDDLLDAGEKVGAFVSQDGDFDQATIDRLASRAGVRLRLFDGVKPLQDELKTHLLKIHLEAWQKNDSVALATVQQNLPSVQAFVRKNIQISENAEGPFAKLTSILDVEVTRVLNVSTPAPINLGEGDEVGLTATVDLRIRAKVRKTPSIFSPPRIMRVGEEAKQELTFTSFLDAESQEELSKTATIEISAVYKNDRFIDLQPRSVSLESPKLLGRIGKPSA